MANPKAAIYRDSNGNIIIQNPRTIDFDDNFTITNVDGRLSITFTGTEGGNAADELAIDSGDHTTFTISNPPLANTLLLINQTTGEIVAASAYTNSGISITFLTSQESDDVTPTFRARYYH